MDGAREADGLLEEAREWCSRGLRVAAHCDEGGRTKGRRATGGGKQRDRFTASNFRRRIGQAV